jgi:hypothetical protein
MDGDLDKWPARNMLPDWLPDPRHPPFGTIYVGWDDDHLYLAAQANLRREPRVRPARFWEGDCFEVFLDLRGTCARDAFGEHCYHFFFVPQGAGSPKARGGLCEPGVPNQVAVADHDALTVVGRTYAQGYRLEVALPIRAIPTFEPATYPRIGFNYVLRDAAGRQQWWSAGPELHPYRDPSTWGILECV